MGAGGRPQGCIFWEIRQYMGGLFVECIRVARIIEQQAGDTIRYGLRDAPPRAH